ncbi:MAG: phage tail sheath C-terminal domain-containing protein [Elainellaceae cyanobacterium]
MARLDYFAPGVYVEEVNRGSRPIQGVSLSVAGFVGFTEDVRGDAELFEPTLVTTWTQYLENFAKPGSDGFTDFGAYLPFAIKGWFENGGGRCWVVSVGTQLPMPDPAPGDSTTAVLEESTPVPTLVLTASKKPSLEFRLKTRDGTEGADSSSDEPLDNKRISVVVQPDEPKATQDPDAFDSGEYFKITVTQGDNTLDTYRHLTMKPSTSEETDSQQGDYVLTALEDSDYIEVEIKAEPGLPLAQRPRNGRYEVAPPKKQYAVKRWYPKMYGNNKDRSGIKGLFEVDDVAMVACPDLMLAYEQGLLSLEQVHGVMEMMITGCENSAPSPAYRMAVIDPPPVKPRRGETPVSPDQQKPQDVEAWLMEGFGRRSQFAALYYPWLKVADPRNAGQGKLVPPCGHMMGIWCRTDETRGIHKAPANEVPRGVLDLAYDTNFREQELLNPKGINCIRKFRDRGLQVWGARTLVEPADVNWRYISVRRLMSYISKSIEMGTQWAVFEPNDEDLWARVTRTVKNFLERLWRSGALFGSSPEQAFYVKCDAELNTPETMKLGILYVEVGIAPVRPAEFVVFRISQWDPSQDQ